MSHDKIICPNCGFHAVGNYCSQCGQETHLHKETFWGLVMHFIGDYFHYDSKFWLTLKALWFSPGKLTLAYWNKQRMRYIKPVSLYIFISAVFFLVSFSSENKWVKVNNGKGTNELKLIATDGKGNNIFIKKTSSQNVNSFIDNKVEKINEEYGNVGKFITEKLNHNLSKIFFFMVPVMALILKLLFIRRKNTFFVDHVIFSLHYHSFWFSLFLLDQFHLPSAIGQFLSAVLILIAAYYLALAMHNVYKANWVRSILNTIVLSVSYVFFLVIIFIASLLVMVAFV